MISNPEFILPDWSAPAHVKAVITTRRVGLSQPPYDAFNLATHVGDREQDVAANRQVLLGHLGGSVQVQWLTQTHSRHVIELNALSSTPLAADGATTQKKRLACAVLTADCLPVLLCDVAGTRVAAVHAGWRGLAQGILAEALAFFPGASAGNVLAYLGPAISAARFQVGGDVLAAFQQAESERPFAESVKHAFVPQHQYEGKLCEGKYLADIYRLARAELRGLGVQQIWGGDFCTVDDERFYSYRASACTGRFASLIWID